MSQRESAGFNWPPLSIPAAEPISITPEAVSRAGPFHPLASTCEGVQFASVKACSDKGLPLDSSSLDAKNSSEADALFESLAAGVAQPAQ